MAIAGFAVLGLGIGVIAPLSFAAAGELSPGDADTVVAQVNVFNYVGFVVGGVVVGLFGSAGVLRAGFVVPLVLTLVIVALAPAFHPRARDRRLAGDRRAAAPTKERAMNPLQQRLERATADLDPPFAVVDLDAFDANARRPGPASHRSAGPGGQQVGPGAHSGRPSRCAHRASRGS